MIYSRFGSSVTLKRMATLEDIQKLENRFPDAHDKKRLEIGYYMVGQYTDAFEGDPDVVLELAFLRADGGIQEIHETARLAGNTRV